MERDHEDTEPDRVNRNPSVAKMIKNMHTVTEEEELEPEEGHDRE